MTRASALTLHLAIAAFILGTASGCDSGGTDDSEGSAQVVGHIALSLTSAKASAEFAVAECPEVVVKVNGVAASVVFEDGDGCSFLITDLPVAEEVTISVELVNEGITGVVVLTDIQDGELIEILVEPSEGALTISVARRVTPEPGDELPVRVTESNVEVNLAADDFDQGLTVDGNNFTLTGVPGESCETDGWATITGDVDVNGNNAIFWNIRFLGDVTVRGNGTSFITSCFGGDFVLFGNPDSLAGFPGS